MDYWEAEAEGHGAYSTSLSTSLSSCPHSIFITSALAIVLLFSLSAEDDEEEIYQRGVEDISNITTTGGQLFVYNLSLCQPDGAYLIGKGSHA